MNLPRNDVVVIGGGVVGAAVTFYLSHCGVRTSLYEKELSFALAASGTNSGCLHTGFDSTPGELETDLILRSAQIRPEIMETLEIPVLKCGATLTPKAEADQETIRRLAENARVNEVHTSLRESDGALEIPGEWITDPVAYTTALLAAAEAQGATLHPGNAITEIHPSDNGFTLSLSDGTQTVATYVVNAAGLYADEVARMLRDESFEIFPRKGEFLVFDKTEEIDIEQILLPVPTERTKGILVFPTIDGRVIAGPTAVDQVDKTDWSVRPESLTEILSKVREQVPALAKAEPIASYSGLRPAGVNTNYVIAPSDKNPHFINAAAVRSTGLSASLGIGEYVTQLLGEQGLEIEPFNPPSKPLTAPRPRDREPRVLAGTSWWSRSAYYFNHEPMFTVA